MRIALPPHRGALVAVAGASTPAKAEVVDALAKCMGNEALVIGNRSHPDPEFSVDALIKVDGRSTEDAVTIVRMAETAAVRSNKMVITSRPVIDELARYRAARRLRHEYVQHHVMRRVEDTVAIESADYEMVVWVCSPEPSRPVQRFERALGEVLDDLYVKYHRLYPPLVGATIETLVKSIVK